MNATTKFFAFIKACGAFPGTILGILITPDDTDSDDRSQGEGSNLFGEYNFRSGKTDSGTDPDGWYEEDM